ncbi:MAG: TIGR03086 family metal-binding protein [Actinomycetota bacterium]|nr:TIGR03086 family metal-binding protein [Actinomycetota bacterium]
MPAQLDLRPAADRFLAIASGVTDDDLERPTPCDGWTVRDLVDHCLVWTIGLRLAGEKAPAMARDTVLPTVANLPDWRATLAEQVRALVDAWRPPAAWEGTTVAGTLQLPAAVMGRSVLAELILHGWDLASALGAPYPEVDAPVDDLTRLFDGSRDRRPDATWHPYGAEAPLPDDATPFDRLLASSGRDPRWAPRPLTPGP